MSERNCMELLRAKWAEGKFVCVGLDSDTDKIPKAVHERLEGRMPGGVPSSSQIQLVFNHEIINATADLVCAYKPNFAFYEKHGAQGVEALRDTLRHIHRVAPAVPVIGDGKRGDIGNTNDGYVDSTFEYYGADGITLHNYLGQESLQPFLKQSNKGLFVLCKTSNPGSGEFQDLPLMLSAKTLDSFERQRGKPLSLLQHVYLYHYVAYRAASHWNANNNVGLVVGATYPEELGEVRQIIGDMPILIPGVGSQGGDLEAAVRAGMDSRKMGFIINSSRGIIFASSGEDYAEAARRETLKLHEAINKIRLAA